MRIKKMEDIIFIILILSVVGILVYAGYQVYKIIKDSEANTKIEEDKNNIKRPKTRYADV